MSTLLLTTKLHIPPPRPAWVSRPHLIARLDESLTHPLTLISAPAGFGKTTLLHAWLHHIRESRRPHPPACAWLMLDQDDSDLARFWTYFVAALQGVHPHLGDATLALLRSSQPLPPEALLTGLLNELAALPDPLVLILDDLHTIADHQIHAGIIFLLDHLPPPLHLVLASRADPPWPLHRLRARGELVELRTNDLRFTPAEAATFLHATMGLDLSPSDVATLEGRTEGWIAGLQLAALSLQNRDPDSSARFIAGFSGRTHFVLDYLADEVLQRQPESVQTFLSQTSILERLCGPLCDAVLGTTGSRTLLERLEHANLFLVPLDDEQQWYRYHLLLVDLLRARLQEAEAAHIPGLHRRAAEWYDQHRLPADAVHHALAARDFALAADLIERAILRATTWSTLDAATFLRWLHALPEDVLRARPRLVLFASRASYAAGRWEASQRLLSELEQSLQASPATPESAQLWGSVMGDRASYAALRGEVRQSIAWAQQALAHPSPQQDATLPVRIASILGLAYDLAGNLAEAARAYAQAISAAQATAPPFVATPFFCSLARVQLVQGQLHQALRTCTQALEVGTVQGAPISAVGFARLEMGQIAYAQNDLPAAERHVRAGLELLRTTGIADAFGAGYAVLAQIEQAQGHDQGALASAQQAVDLAQGSGIPRLLQTALAYQARIGLAQGKLNLAARWAHAYRQLGATEYLREFEDLTLARVLLAQDRPAEALALLDALLPAAEAAGRMGRALEAQALQALAQQALGRPGAALAALERALWLAEPEGYVRLFLDEGAPMAHLLPLAAAELRDAAQAPLRAHARRLLAAFPGTASPGAASLTSPVPASSPAVPGAGRPPLPEPLTDREMEVLRLLADRLSNAEIAQRLVISLPTVKSHTRNIYGKLGANTRQQAVAQARVLGLLPAS